MNQYNKPWYFSGLDGWIMDSSGHAVGRLIHYDTNIPNHIIVAHNALAGQDPETVKTKLDFYDKAVMLLTHSGILFRLLESQHEGLELNMAKQIDDFIRETENL